MGTAQAKMAVLPQVCSLLLIAVSCASLASGLSDAESLVLDDGSDAAVDYQVTAFTFGSDIALLGKDAHFSIEVKGTDGTTGEQSFGVGPDTPGTIVRKQFSGVDVGDVQKVKISSQDSKSIVVFQWVKVKQQGVSWYGNMPYLVNFTATPNPTSLEAEMSRCEGSSCEELEELE